jgi:hypothetical protein
MKLVHLKAVGLVILLFLCVYVPTFIAVRLIKPRAEVAIPLIIALSSAIAVTFICFLSLRARNFSEFGFRNSSYRFIWIAVALGVPIGLGLTFIASRFHSTNPFAGVSLQPWMIFLYFIIGTPIQEEVIFRGLLQTTLEQQLGVSFPITGISISSAVLIIAVLFALIHLAVGVLTAIAAFILGLLAGELRRRSSSLLPAIVLHAIFNAFSAVW